jgi:hypothetical protein
VDEDEVFAVHPTYDGNMWLGLGWSVTHIPSGFALSHGHACREHAQMVAAVWRALPLPWNRKQQALRTAMKKLPDVWKQWISAMRADMKPAPQLQRDVMKAKRKAAKP